MAAKTFDEWVHEYMETPHSARSSGEWLRTAWDAATQAAEARLASTNIQSASASQIAAEMDMACTKVLGVVIIDQMMWNASLRQLRAL